MKFNRRIVSLYLTAVVFVVLSFEQLAPLRYIEFVRGFHEVGVEEYLKQSGHTLSDVVWFAFWNGIVPAIGVLMVSCVALLQTVRRGLWINALLVLVMGFIIRYVIGKLINPWSLVYSFGRIFEPFGIEFYFLANGLLYLSIAVAVLFYTLRVVPNNAIDKGAALR